MIRLAFLIRDMLKEVGEDTDREGLKDTPTRAARAWLYWTSGYEENPNDILKSFEDGGETYDEMILVRGIPFYSHCEHHMAPFFGSVTIGYVPNGKILGLSKFSRLVDMFAHRLQVQERLTEQIANALTAYLKPKGVAVSITARHLCMESRGIAKQGSETITNELQGVFRTDPAARLEFLTSTR